jgi:hypothetical protein
MSQQFIAIVKTARAVNTKHGQRVVITCSGNLKSEFTIWRRGDDSAALNLKAGDRITCVVDSKGKESWVDNIPAVKPGEPIDYLPNSGSALATLIKPVPTTEEIPDNAGGEFDRHIESLASKIADCYKATKKQLPDLSEETIQKLATSVFIRLCEDTY